MVFCPIPSQHTEEEKFLQQKYSKLKKKKKLLLQQKAPKPEQSAPTLNTQNQLKRGADGPKQDAKELAKKLIKSGAISAIKPPEKEKQGFKRSNNSQRKRLEQQADNKPKYQPFSAVYKPELESNISGLSSENGGRNLLAESSLPTKEKEAIAREETFRERRRDGKAHYVNRDVPNVGTIYVHGIGITELLLKNTFNKFGNIIKVNCEFTKNCGFVTFESIDQANSAIDAINGTQVNNIQLKVSLARKQPFLNKQTDANSTESTSSQSSAPPNNASMTPQNTTTPQTSNSSFTSNNDWSSIAATYEQKNKQTKDKRTLIAYDDIY